MLSNKNRPAKFKQYISQSYLVNVLTTLVKQNTHTDLRVLLIAGPSGTGKTTIANLYAQATLCYNRPDGEIEPCGECPACTGEDISNITSYTIAKATEAKEKVEELIEIAKSKPLIKNEATAHRARRIIIVDELELASPETIASLLQHTEFCPSSTTWIFCSMDIAKLRNKNEAICEAIESRCAVFPLAEHTPKDIADRLCQAMPQLDYEAALTIGIASKGNFRKAWSVLDSLCVPYTVQDITSDIVYAKYLGGADTDTRDLMWKQLEASNLAAVGTIFDGWENTSDLDMVANLLEDDIYQALEQAPDTQMLVSLLQSLSRWKGSSHKYKLKAAFLPYAKLALKPNQKASSKPVLPATIQENFSLKLQGQMAKINRLNSSLPPIIRCNTFKEFIECYT